MRPTPIRKIDLSPDYYCQQVCSTSSPIHRQILDNRKQTDGRLQFYFYQWHPFLIRLRLWLYPVLQLHSVEFKKRPQRPKIKVFKSRSCRKRPALCNLTLPPVPSYFLVSLTDALSRSDIVPYCLSRPLGIQHAG